MPDPRDPETDEMFPPGPIRLASHQRRIIDEALSKDSTGKLKYSTIVYSATKKSGKSTLTSAVILYMAYHNANSFLACLANDGKQSADRLYGPIQTCCRLHRQLGGLFELETPFRTELILSNHTKIEAIPCDAAGEAGSQPLMSSFSELWGFSTPAKKQVFTELSIPPTLYGRAIRWIESYAGYSGTSELLEQIYTTGFIEGTPHPDFLDLQGKYGPVVRVNESARMFVYWDTEPRMVWQSKDYYAQEAAILPPSEFRRIHRNEWVTATDSFINDTWWDACEKLDLPALADGDKTPMVVGIDMAVSRDCAALVGVTRDPDDPEHSIAVRAVKIFDPKSVGGTINQELLIKPVLSEWSKRWNVVCFVYDPREMAKLAQDLTREGFGWFKAFGQAQPRMVSDKQLHDMVVQRQITWNRDTTYGDIGYRGSGGETLYKHMTQAGSITTGESYRLEKLSTKTKIDGAVALSQAAFTAMQLVLDNLERVETSLIERYRRGELSTDEFTRLVREKFPRATGQGYGRT